VPGEYRIWSSLFCYNCGADLLIKLYRTARHKSAYSRKPLSDDGRLDYSFPSPPPRIRDLVSRLPPTRTMDTSKYARPFPTRDTSYPADSEFHTTRIFRAYEKPTFEHDRRADIRREKTDIHFDSFPHRPRLTVGDLSPPLIYSRDGISLKPKLIPKSTSIRPRFCLYQNLCREYIWSLNWPRDYFNSRFNRCYCSQCYPESYNDTYKIAGNTYVIPRGWVRFGLYVDKVKADHENIWDRWIVTYHGTTIPAALSIIAHRQFLLPGDTCDDGTRIRIRSGHIPGKIQVYTSPTIKYSSLDCYCAKYRYSASDGKQYEAKIVLQCRQQPGSYGTQGETVGSGSKRICDIIPNERIEIFTTVRAAVVPYGLLVQLTPI